MENKNIPFKNFVTEKVMNNFELYKMNTNRNKWKQHNDF